MKIGSPPKLTDIRTVRSTLEDLDNYLRRRLGTSGLPLAYVTREDIAIPAPADDPGFGMPDFTSEMVRRGDHTDDSYQLDNTTVWTIIRHVTHRGQGWSWVSKYARSTNGRAAYFALIAHYLGDSYVSRKRSNADKIMKPPFMMANPEHIPSRDSVNS